MLSTALVLSGLLASACSSDSSPDGTDVPPVTGWPSENVPLVFPLQATPAGGPESPALSAEVPVRLDVSDPDDPYRQSVSLINAGAESAAGQGPIPGNAVSDGFTVEGTCLYSDQGVAAGNGQWRFVLEPGCALTQLTDAVLATGQGLTLDFDSEGSATGNVTLEAELLALDSDGSEAEIIARRSFSMPASAHDWQSHQFTLGFGALDAHVAKRIGVRFRHAGGADPLSLDAVSVQLHSADPDRSLRFLDQWNWQCDQQWAGEHFWSNRLRDWQVHEGRLESTTAGRSLPMRTTHRSSTELSAAPGPFAMSVATGLVSDAASQGSFSGFLIGSGHGLDYRAAALVHNRHGRNGGLIAGIDAEGRAFIRDNGPANVLLANGPISMAAAGPGAQLQVRGDIQSDGNYRLSVFVLDGDANLLSSTTTRVSPVRLAGSIAVISNPGNGGTSHWFDDWQGLGQKLQVYPNRQFGPVLFASYTLSQGTLTLNAQYPPACADAFETPRLQVGRDGEWVDVASATIDPASYTAQFRVRNWDSGQRHRYRVVTVERASDAPRALYFDGVIQADPVDKEELVIGVFNCRPGVILSGHEGWIQQNSAKPFTWTRERIAMPHEELLDNAQRHDMDLITFLGDQLYEFDPNGLIEKEDDEIIIDYLWKWYQFGWSVRDLIRDTPSFMLPDDHDVYQSNIWGQNGVKAPTENEGGYVYSADFVNVVQRTQTGSLPAPYDPTPVEQGIGVYYTQMIYGGIGMAVLEDRKFKTGPNSPLQPRQLLGERQARFLDQWSRDWRGQQMKLAISQSPFSQSTTHSGAEFKRMRLDQDSNGWPKTGRDEAVRLLRNVQAPHVAGDQHLGMTLRHGIDSQDDAVYSFAGPSMLNIFPRIWDPLNEAAGPGDPSSTKTGSYTDAHGNLITVIAVANPHIYYQPIDTLNSPSKDDLGIGYGIVRLDKAARRYTFEAWPANQDPSAAGAAPYEGWPVTVSQADNDGRIPTGYLTPRQAPIDAPLVVVEDERDGSLVYARRLTSGTVELPVFDNNTSYTVIMSDPDGSYQERWMGQRVGN